MPSPCVVVCPKRTANIADHVVSVSHADYQRQAHACMMIADLLVTA